MSTSFRSLRHQPVTLSPGGVSIGGVPLNDDGAIRLPGSRQALNGRHLRLTAKHFSTLLPGGHPPQLSLLAFNLTDDPQTLEHYFPLAQSMPANIKTDFYRTLTHLAETQTLVVTLTGSAKRDRTPALPAGIRHLLAGMILEPLFFRPDLLERFFQHPKLFRFYTSAQALREDGGVSGGCYQPRKRIMQLALSRLWEGCDQPQVGTSPFLHEFGHMLDAFDERSGLLGSLDGFLPGMDEPARKAFNEGKAIELARYQECQHQAQPDRSRQPLGHPYVFQNDREFLAGYFEMFFRNPGAFASRNPTLYQAFSSTLRQDPRDWLPADYNGYLVSNFDTYRSGKGVPSAGIRLT